MSRIYFFIFFLFSYCSFSNGEDLKIYISPNGNDTSTGLDIATPKKSIGSVLEQIQKLRKTSKERISVILMPGEYYLEKTIEIGPATGPLSIEAYESGTVCIKGSKILTGKWEQHKDGIQKLKTAFAISPYSQLYVNGKEQVLARYPNYDSLASHYHGYAADAIDPKRIAKWKNPQEAIVHAMHNGEWGDFHYVIDGVDKHGDVTLKGGQQNNRPAPMHKEYRMVENVFEELDAPGEWYFEDSSPTLYLIPFNKTDLSTTKIEVSFLDHLVEIKGTSQNPVSNISIKGIRFEHSNRTFMKDYEPLLRSDWTIYRGAAIYFENAENCQVLDCELLNLGGNAIFASGYNRDINIIGNHISQIGASAMSFVGLSSAVRSPSFNYNEFVDFEYLDTIPGPKSDTYPANCLADNNLIHDIGLVEKQVAGVQISMAIDITVSHNSIYDVPRSGINVSEGTWGGHIIEFNDVFNTVLETSDHGAFNSWGRDRFWHPNRKTMDKIMEDNPKMPYLDAVKTTIIRNNRMRCDHGWDIDLDDGSSNYHLYNNLCLNGGIKLREGFYRTVENNIMVNNGFHPHVWFKNSGDVFDRNIVMTAHQDIRLDSWGKEVDYNLFPDSIALKKAQQNGTDQNSLSGNPLFVDPIRGDFTVSNNSPALSVGFKNFPMDQFGVQIQSLKQMAKTPVIPELIAFNPDINNSKTMEWLGATLKNIETMGERSATGLTETSGALILNVKPGSLAAKAGLQAGDVILNGGENEVKNIADLMNYYQGNNWKGELNLIIFRNQVEKEISLKTK